MSGCTLQLSRDSPLRTVLVDQATGNAKYQIDTPIRLTRSVTRIRKLDSPTHPHHHWDEDVNSDYGGADSDSSEDTADKGKQKKKSKKHKEEGDEAAPELPETSDEIARIYWSWFTSDKIVFRGKITTRSEFLPKTGKMGG